MRYFAFGYIPPPGSLLKGVKKLAGGDFATYHVDSHTIDVGSYWRYRVEASARTSGTEDDWADELRSRIKDSVVRRLDSDVPLGFFLSGGLDSTAILALARDHLGNQPIDTFTMGVADPSYDERRQAEQTSKLFGTRHHQRVLDFEAASELIDGLLQKVDEPIAETRYCRHIWSRLSPVKRSPLRSVVTGATSYSPGTTPLQHSDLPAHMRSSCRGHSTRWLNG